MLGDPKRHREYFEDHLLALLEVDRPMDAAVLAAQLLFERKRPMTATRSWCPGLLRFDRAGNHQSQHERNESGQCGG